MLLPVIGAWVGAVLAFYFGNENFDAASKSAANLVSELSPREKLKAESASHAIMKIVDGCSKCRLARARRTSR